MPLIDQQFAILTPAAAAACGAADRGSLAIPGTMLVTSSVCQSTS